MELARSRGALQLRVRDSGIGMGACQPPKLFAKFYQAHGGNTRRFGGTGLGLSIAQELATAMMGRIAVESEPGVGSIFQVDLALIPRPSGGREGASRIVFHVTQDRAAELTASPSQSVAGHLDAEQAPSILVAEDNPTDQLVVRTLLQAFGIVRSSSVTVCSRWRSV